MPDTLPTSPLLSRPLRSEAQASADIAAERKRVTVFRWYVSGYSGADWETVSGWGVSPEDAMRNALRNHRLGRAVLDGGPDQAMGADNVARGLTEDERARFGADVTLVPRRELVEGI